MMQQGTEDWLKARVGKITASRFGDVLTRGRGKDNAFGKVAMLYAYEIVAGILTGEPKDEVSARSLDWGKKWESVARDFYQRRTFNLVDEVGFVGLEGDKMVGCSPDGLIDEDGGIEIKCPSNSSIHLSTILKKEIPDVYVPQVQGSMWVTGRKWWDFVSFDPRYKDVRNKMVIVKVERDEEYIDMLCERVDEFKGIINNILIKV